MNLQINSPYKPCQYKCPYCCAAYEDGVSRFKDDESTSLFYTDREKYSRRLHSLLMAHEFDAVVITGSTEPTYFMDWLRCVLQIAENHNCKIEVATRNEGFWGKRNMHAVCYSFHDIPRHVWRSSARHTRTVFVLTDRISIDDIIEYHWRSGGQTTVKNLADNSYGNKRVDRWVRKHRVDLSEDDIKRLRAEGIRYDRDCNNSEDRYLVYRADGNLYDSWQSVVPMSWEGAS